MRWAINYCQQWTTIRSATFICDAVFISPRYTWGPIYGSQSLKQTDLWLDLTEVTLADGDTNSILLIIRGKVMFQGANKLQMPFLDNSIYSRNPISKYQ